MDDDERRRTNAFWKISHTTRHGEVDGIEFDLRHPDLNPDEWVLENLQNNTSDYGRLPHMPFFWYPWNGEFIAADLRRKFAAASKRYGIRKSKAELSKDIEDCTPDAFIYAGDKITIRKIEKVSLENSLKHKHDENQIFAYLNIVRKSGTVFEINRPLIFFGKMSLRKNPASSHVSIIDKIKWRIFQHFHISDFSDPRFDSLIPPYPESLSSDERAYRELWTLPIRLTPTPTRFSVWPWISWPVKTCLSPSLCRNFSAFSPTTRRVPLISKRPAGVMGSPA